MTGITYPTIKPERPDWTTSAHRDRLERMGADGRAAMARAMRRIGRDDVAELIEDHAR